MIPILRGARSDPPEDELLDAEELTAELVDNDDDEPLDDDDELLDMLAPLANLPPLELLAPREGRRPNALSASAADSARSTSAPPLGAHA
jgi:hypothetical protein